MKYFKKLVGERIYLSPRNPEDAETFTCWLNDFNTTDYLGRSHMLYTLNAEKEYLENSGKNSFGFGIVTLVPLSFNSCIGCFCFLDLRNSFFFLDDSIIS